MPSNPYLDLLNQEEQAQTAGIGAAATLTHAVNPDAAGRARQVAGMLGVPPAVVEATPEDSEREALIRKIDVDTAQTPTLRRKYTDADFMKLARDDSTTLAGLERSLRQFMAGGAGKQQVQDALSWIPRAGRAIASGAPKAGAGLYGAAAAPFELLGLDTIGGFLRDQQEQANLEAKRWSPPNTSAGIFERGVMSGFQSAGQTLLTLPLGLAGGARAALTPLGAITFGDTYGRARDAGLSPARAIPYAAQDATAEVITEKYLGVGGFLQNIKAGASAGKLFMFELTKEVPGEMAATLWQNFNEWQNVNPEKSVAEFIKEQPAALAETVIATLVGGSTQIGVVKGIERAMGRKAVEVTAATRAEQQSAVLQEIMQLAAASKVRERHAETFEAYLQQATEDGPLERVYVNPKEMEAAGLDLTQLAEVAPTFGAQAAQALETGQDVAIPIAELATRLPGTELESVLLQHLKTDPGGFSQAGAQVYMQTQGEAARQEVEKELEAHEADTAFRDSVKAVEDSVREQLHAANRFTDDVNAPYASMWAAFFGVQAARVGTTPKELFDRFAPRIVAQTPAGALLEQDVPVRPLKQAGEPPGPAAPGTPATDSPAAAGRVTTGAPQQDRAEVTRGSFDPNTNTVALLQAANLSTFLHESGHFFLEVLADLASQQNAPAQIVEDFDAFLRWTGVGAPPAAEGDKSTAAERRAAAWAGMSLEERRAHHEDFARGFEAYLWEGKAPSIEVQGLFQRFRAWLLNVYAAVTQLNVNLTPEIRRVFDRMLATNEQIQLAQDARGYEALFKNKPEGMTDDEWAVYQIQANDATQQAVQELQARSLRDMRWLANAKSRELKRLQAEAKARRAEIEKEVRAEVEALPVYEAIADIKSVRKSDPQDRAAVKAWEEARDAERTRLMAVVKQQYLETPEGAATKGIQRGQFLARSKRAMANEVEKLMLQWEQQNAKPKVSIPEPDLDVVAQLHNFTSGDELRKAIEQAQPLESVVEGMTDQRMLERHGDLVDDGAIERAAEEAIHNDARLRFTATELNALRKATGQPALLAKAIRTFAADIVARTKVRELKPSVYTAAERRAAADAKKAADEGKIEDAAVQKRNQLINGYAAKAALAAQDEAAKIVEYLSGFNRESVYRSLDADYIEQIHAMLERFDLRTGESLKAIDKRTSLAKWLAAQEEAGLEPEIPPELADESRRTHFKNLTMEELRGLRDTIKQIEHLGRLKHKLLTAKDQRDYEQVRDAIVASIEANAGDKHADNRTRPTGVDAAIRMFNGYLLEHRKVASLVREMDGFKDGGTFWEYFVRSMNEAGDREATMRAEAAGKLAALVKPMLEGGKRGGSGQFFPGVGQSFNREERLGIALNMGNAGNVQRLLGGEGWSLAQVKPILDTLTEADWRFVQSVWDFLESYRPLVAAKERRVYGKEPNWVDPQPLTVQTADGKTITLRGGYFPIKYDTARSGRAEAHADAEVAKQMMRGAYTSATTRRSFTKTRAEEVTGRPLLYSTDALFNGVNEIIHDLSWHEWLIDANRLLRSKSIDNAIRNRYGAEVARQLKAAVKDIAAGEFPAATAFERVSSNLRAGTMIAGLGLNITNSIINVSGLTQSMVRIGMKWTGVGIAKFAQGPVELSREVAAKSDLMANRARTLNREVNEIQSMVRDKSALRQAADRIMFLPLTMTQQLVDLPTWWGAYQKALDAGEAEARAVSLADQSVLDAQSGGQVKDLAQIQRGHPLLKLWTTFYGFFSSTYNLTVESTKATDFKDPGQVVQLVGKYLLLWTLPALVGTLLKNLLSGGDWDDEEKLAKKMIGDQVSYLLGMMIGLREIGMGAQKFLGVSEFNMAYGGPAGARFLGELDKLLTQAGQGEADAPFWKALNNVGGILFKYPATQINRTAEGAAALIQGETGNPLALVAGPPKN